MEDPDSPANGQPPPPPSPKEEWGAFDGAEHLTHLTDSNFDNFVKKQDSVLVMFYAPCKLFFKLNNTNREIQAHDLCYI